MLRNAAASPSVSFTHLRGLFQAVAISPAHLKTLKLAMVFPAALACASPFAVHSGQGEAAKPAASNAVTGVLEALPDGAAHASTMIRTVEKQITAPDIVQAGQSMGCNEKATPVAVSRSAETPIVGIDYGHAAITSARGSRDMGAPKGPKFSTTELQVINSAGRALEPVLQEKGVAFTTTRGAGSTDRFNWPHGYKESVAARGNVLYANGADAAVSLHADVRNSNNSGIHIYVYRPDVRGGKPDAASLALAQKMATAFRAELKAPVSIMSQDFSLLRNFHLSCKQNSPEAACPAVLIEIGNLHNRTDVARMTSPDWMQRFAGSLGNVLAAEVRDNKSWNKPQPMTVAKLSLNCSLTA